MALPEPTEMYTASLLCGMAVLALPVPGEPVQLQYSIGVSQQTREEAIPKSSAALTMTILSYEDGIESTWRLAEPGKSELDWPERFGRWHGTHPTPLDSPRLRVRHQLQTTDVVLQGGWYQSASKLAAGASWTDGLSEFRVRGSQKVDKLSCWQIDVANRRGITETLLVDQQTGLIQESVQRVVLGQGEEYEITLRLDQQTPLTPEQRQREQTAAGQWLGLRTRLAIAPLPSQAGSATEVSGEPPTKWVWDPARIEVAQTAIPTFLPVDSKTSWEGFGETVQRELTERSKQLAGIAGLREKLIGQQVPPLKWVATPQLPAPTIAPNQVVVLHFWDYRHDELVEPYGQVGYLEFLHTRRKKLGVHVQGVAVNAEFTTPNSTAAISASLGVQKLRDFMRLTYPIAADDGTNLRALGDPAQFGGTLPLWVVIDPTGNVAHYQTGYYNINPDRGLEELDAAVLAALKKRQTR